LSGRLDHQKLEMKHYTAWVWNKQGMQLLQQEAPHHKSYNAS